jgi:Tfp pilus assembly protein PilF
MALADVERDEYEFTAAESEYKRALELNPNLGAAHLSYGVMLTALAGSAKPWNTSSVH